MTVPLLVVGDENEMNGGWASGNRQKTATGACGIGSPGWTSATAWSMMENHLPVGVEPMDRVTNSYVQTFAVEHELTTLPQDRLFEHFAAYVTVRSLYNGEAFSTSDIVTGSGGDTGIDAIAILVNGSLVTDIENLAEHANVSGNFDVNFVFVQAKSGSSFDASKIGTFGFGVRDFFSTSPKLARNKMIEDAAEIMNELYEKYGTKFRPGNPICRLYYITTGTWAGGANLEARRSSEVADLRAMQIFREVEFLCIGADGVQKLYRNSKSAIQREFSFSNRILVPDIPGVSEAYVGFVPLSEFLSLITDENGEMIRSIFYDNVRDWQEYNAVNMEIKDTVLSDYRERFVSMNNGITVIANSMRTTRRDRIQIEDFQIVNGCQTSHVLFD